MEAPAQQQRSRELPRPPSSLVSRSMFWAGGKQHAR